MGAEVKRICGKVRIDWQDSARGFGILLVVYGHVVRGLFQSDILTSPAWARADFAIYTFHMPLFFFLSGLNVFPARQEKGFF